MDAQALLEWVGKADFGVLCAIALYSLHRGWIVLGREYQSEKKRGDAYQALLEKLANVTSKAIATERD